MNSLPQIEAAITQLSRSEAHELLAWLQSYVDDTWDRQIEAEAKTGRLDKLIQQAEADIATNRTKPLDEVLHNF